MAQPYPASTTITSITWDTNTSTGAAGSDLWHLTWSDDDALYTPYGDGWGFQNIGGGNQKWSMNWAKVTGTGASWVGTDINSNTATTGDGTSGDKGMSIISVSGDLYTWVKLANTDTAEIWKSTDKGLNWTKAGWTYGFTSGRCFFVNFGQDNAGARDTYVYSLCTNGAAYPGPTNAFIMSRVPNNDIMTQGSHEFISGGLPSSPTWSTNEASRVDVFTCTNCSQNGRMVYNAPLSRYLFVLRSRDDAGGIQQFSVYDSPEPWGPFTTVYYTTTELDGSPLPDKGDFGFSPSIPSKWISADGLTVYLVADDNDEFTVRRGVLTIPGESTCNTSASCQTAINAAQPGETVTFQNGTYTACSFTTNRNGTSGSPITIQSQNLFGAVLNCGANEDGFTINHNWITLKKFLIRNTDHAVNVNGNNNTISELRIYDVDTGIEVNGGDVNTIELNYIGPQVDVGGSATGVRIDTAGSDNIIQNNIIWGQNTGGDAPATPDTDGIAIRMHGDGTDRNVTRGNIFAGTDKDLIRPIFSPELNEFRSNIMTWDWGGLSCRDYETPTVRARCQIINNLFINNSWSIHNKGNPNGDNRIEHNTFILTDFSHVGYVSGRGTDGGHDEGRILIDNVFYSAIATPSTGQRLTSNRDFNATESQGGFSDHNCYYSSAGTQGNWNKDVAGNFAYDATDVRAQPTFTDAANGDYTLTTGNCKGSGTGGDDPGISYDTYLTLRKARLVDDMDTIENTGLQGSTSTALTGADNQSRYLLFTYLPTSGFTTSNVTWTIEGVNTAVRDTNDWVTGQFNINGEQWVNGSARYVGLMPTATDGTINVSWTNSNATERIFAVRFPRDKEGHAWMKPADYPVTLVSMAVEDATPTNVNITLNTSGFNPIRPASCSGFTCRKNASSWTVNSCAKVGDNGIDLTMADAAISTDTLDCSYSQSTGNVESDVLIELTAFTQSSVTNNVAGGGSSVISVSPSSLDYGQVDENATKDLSVTVTNTGTALLTISNITFVTGTKYAVVSPAVPFNVAVGNNQVVTVRFTPAGVGTFTDTMTIDSNATDPTVSLTGEGAAGAPAGPAVPGLSILGGTLE